MATKKTAHTIMPLLALRGLVVFPGMLLNFDVGRKMSVGAVSEAMNDDQTILLVSQMDMREEDPHPDNLYRVGCVARIKQVIKLRGETMRVIVEGISRAKVVSVEQGDHCLYATAMPLLSTKKRSSELQEQALLRSAAEALENYATLVPKLSPDVTMTVHAAKEAGPLSDFIASNIMLSVEDKQAVLAQTNELKRLEQVITVLINETQVLAVEKEIEDRVREQIDENQREYYLREQLKIISSQLNDGDNPQQEADGYHEKINRLKLDEESSTKLHKEADRLHKMPQGSHEATVVRNYLDTCLELPWHRRTNDKTNLAVARGVLDRDHYGMEKVKERILEFLSVRQLAPDIRGQILCLVGPPGVGKTSVARSIAQCMGRQYARVSLGGVRDEADIRGHRRTYIGAMPGRILNAVRQAGTKNPLILLDEVDKLGNDYRGDPSAALLEALDPEQNVSFRDHYVELSFDLSDVLFITTANRKDTIPPALLDRMEVIDLSSYTREEKFHIARRHLIKKQLKRHGLTAARCRIEDDAVYGLIDFYTREAGVRSLEREIASLCRKAARRLVEGDIKRLRYRLTDLNKALGPHRFKPEVLSLQDEMGVVNGLAWTTVGGEMMQIEVAVLEGSGKIVLTGSLGDVMKESAQTAVSCVRSHAPALNIDRDFYKTKDIHVHAPEGAVPKDGPSAGITIATALVSALSGVAVRHDVAMTGEVTLRGRILPIGGLKEKTMAALRAGIKTVLIPEDNLPDLAEVDPAVKTSIRFVGARCIETVWETALHSGYLVENAPPLPETCHRLPPDRGGQTGPGLPLTN